MSQNCYCDGVRDGFALSWELNRLHKKIYYLRQLLYTGQVCESNKLRMLELKLEKISIFADPFLCCEAKPTDCKKKLEHLFELFNSVKERVEALKIQIEIPLVAL